MDTSKYMIIVKGEICTSRINSCSINHETNRYDVTYDNGNCYPYAINNVVFLNNPTILQPQNYTVEGPDGKQYYDIKWIYEFDNKGEKYWHIVFPGFELDFKKSDLILSENCLADEKSSIVFDYLKEISELSGIKNDSEDIILKKYYDKVSFISDNSVLSVYLDSNKRFKIHSVKKIIFPFGCNQSQHNAVRNALNNQISIIQGPPGTGKTQTILNIIANLIVNNKTVLIVSNNNSATQNIIEKLRREEYALDFMVAPLGNVENKTEFITAQTGVYPNLSAWIRDDDVSQLLSETTKLAENLQRVYFLKERIARLREQYYEIELESRHFEEYATETAAYYKTIKVKDNLSSKKVMRLWQELQYRADTAKDISLMFKIKSILVYGIADWKFYRQEISKIISVLQGMYYQQVLKELKAYIVADENELLAYGGSMEEALEEKSLEYLRSFVSTKYAWNDSRIRFTEEDLFKRADDILNEYPIVLSTTFSARASLNMGERLYDYVIMDEASQVDVATGALALSCAKNAVIVGDLKQLPNVVDPKNRKKAELIKTKYCINDSYDFAQNSFLQSIVSVISDAPATLLKEHYRCHPRIINFCNQKFYNNELVIMTQDDGKGEALAAIKTVEGNHARGNYNQRQIDVIKDEILPTLNVPCDEIGIIAPYNDQVNEMAKQIPDIEVATVHKFQGREKDVIILSTVDNQIRDFTDDPYLLNVAVSRAKKRLIVVISGNEQADKGNIVDLVSYIQYNKMEVIDSKIFSVFDYLYSQYREKRLEFLRGKKRISEYDSENLTYNLLLDIIDEYPEYGVLCFEPLSMIIRDVSHLSEEEVIYLMNPSTHIDFMIYNKLSKRPVLAIETDGYSFHKKGTAQHERDKLKDHIMEVAGIRLIRLSTIGSDEKDRIKVALST